MTNLPLVKGRGGNHHHIAVKQFILDHLARVGEDYISNTQRAYNDALDQLAWDRRRKEHYHHVTSRSFSVRLWELIGDGRVEFSGREEPSDDIRFADRDVKPKRRFYRLVR